MQKHFVVSILCLWISCTGYAQQNADAIRRALLDPSGSVLVAAHRAEHHRYPENSLRAIQAAIDLGVDIVEVDVKVSKDGVPFLMHDKTADRTTNGKGDPETMTWSELQQLFLVDKGKRTSLKIPSLEEALTVASGKILVDLDLKTDRIDNILRIIRKTETKDIVFFFDSDYTVLSAIRAADTNFMIMPRAYRYTQADSAIALFDPPVVHIDDTFYTAECIQLIKSSYARAWINALGEPDEEIRKGKEKHALKKLLKYGASIIQTDEPQKVIQALKEGGWR
jgi:glycerophosphoryl diester phosphodiesterase